MSSAIDNRRHILLLGSLLIAGVWTSCGGAGSSIAGTSDATGAPKASVRTGVTALGRVEPTAGFIEIATGAPDRISKLPVTEGDWVEEGEVLLVLETRTERKQAVELARTRLAEARLRHESELVLARAELAEAKVGLERARKVPPLHVEALESEVERLQVQVADARKSLERFEALAERNSVSQGEKDHYETAYKETEKALKGAATRLEEAQVSRRLEEAQAERRVDTAQAALDRALDAGNLGELEKQLELAESQSEQTIIRAPTAGEILKIYARPGESAGGKPLILLGNTRQLCVVAEVYETDVGEVSRGQRAEVTSRALPDRLTGSVDRIGHIVLRNQLQDLDPSARVDRRVVEVRILLDDPSAARKFLNLEVDVKILTGGESPEAG